MPAVTPPSANTGVVTPRAISRARTADKAGAPLWLAVAKTGDNSTASAWFAPQHRAQRMGRGGDQPAGIFRPPMRRLPRARFRQMQAIGADGARQRRIIGNQQNQSPRPGDAAQARRQLGAALGIARPHDHKTAGRQGARRRQRIGQAQIVGHQYKLARIEAQRGPC